MLGRVEERCRVRLHQAANRMEDHDPVSVGGASALIRVLNVVDRVTSFRAVHRASVSVPSGSPGPPPIPSPTPHPEWGGLVGLDQDTRLELREKYRKWERTFPVERRPGLDGARDDGGLAFPATAAQQAAWRAWRDAWSAAKEGRENAPEQPERDHP